jgi:Domain of unknown function (DUF1707)
MPDPQMRAADTDREAVVRRLGEHMSTGRLTLEEYEERSAAAYAAKTYGDLAKLTTDLPSPAHVRPAAPTARSHASYAGSCGAGPWAGSRRSAWSSWATTAIVVLSIWLVTSIASGGLLYFWPFWVIGPWGAVLLVQTLGGGPGRSRRRLRR